MLHVSANSVYCGISLLGSIGQTISAPAQAVEWLRMQRRFAECEVAVRLLRARCSVTAALCGSRTLRSGLAVPKR